jgi:hypothetical protein
MPKSEKDKPLKPRKITRALSSAKEEAESKAATKKPAAKPAKKPAKAAKESAAKPPKATLRKKTTAAKPAARKRVRAVALVPAEVAESRQAVIVIPPHSTIEGTAPHAAAMGPNAVIAVHAAKYEMTPLDRIVEPVYPEERETELPAQYGDTKLVLMVRDPEWLFLYWEIGRAHREMLGLPPEKLPERLVVRLHDVTAVEEFNGTNSIVWYEIPITGGAISWYVHLPQVERAWCAELGVLNAQGEFIQICRSNTVRTPRSQIAKEADPQWMSVAEELREILARSADVSVSSRIGSEAAIRQISRRLRLALEKQELGSGAVSPGLRVARAVAPQESPIPGGDMPLSVRTEIVVSGTTDPRASVTIQGRPIAVRSDGSFSLRFELPDGEQVVAVRAVSKDGSMSREIVPVVRRETRPSAN